MTSGSAFHYAAAGGTPEAFHKEGFEKSVEKCAGKSMSPHMTLKAAGAHCGLLPGKFFPKKVYLLEIHVNE